MRILLLIFLFFASIQGSAQNGKILNKIHIDLEKSTFWDQISINNEPKPEYEYLENLNFFFITYLSDSKKVKGYIVEPKKKGKYPVVIFNRGGNRNFAALNLATMIVYTSKLANEGYFIIGSNYREKDELGGSDLNDVLNLTETIKDLDKADNNLIGMFGWSRGGLMTYLALKNSNKIKTAIVGNGPADFFKTVEHLPGLENVLEECVPNYCENRNQELKKRSVVYWPEKLDKNSSLLILAGTKDKRVDFKQAEEIGEKLKAINYDYELQIFDTDHFFSNKKEELNNAVILWFNRELKTTHNNG
ncbi:prolyl oligopeptidase family serine peptidase [Gramella lutea]|uniref:Prolyl oligopeptidase family serine peptidase n=1 Tax=Christiangramia lutea TaxID=1607951 RepID=A0A9X1V5U4_9FLAO|nr:prolyl oligopeptidase family serine peptidase [Christiangramia lutea]MCH4824658.1 prolyl oligopeptidase family serine peptidase [Christiangramia lutea]